MKEENIVINKKKTSTKRLGMGLSALLGGVENLDMFNFTSEELSPSKEIKDEGFSMIAIKNLVPNENQPRKVFKEEELKGLADSIAKNGILQPILVRPLGENSFQIVAGERRFRASILAGFKEIPCVIKTLSEEEVCLLALIENIQREELNPIEESESYIHLMKAYGYTQERIAETIGKSRSYIANLTRLHNLPLSLKEIVASGKLTVGHVRPLLCLKNPQQMLELAEIAITQGYSVRKMEEVISALPTQKAFSTSENTDNILQEPLNMEIALAQINKGISSENNDLLNFISTVSRSFHQKFESPIKIKPFKKGGMISIKYNTQRDLEAIMQQFLNS